MNTTTGSIVTRVYRDFRGVDFSNKNVSVYRSPNALNVWKNYKESLGKCIETRPDIELVDEFEGTIYGLFFYTVNNELHKIVHCENKLYDNGEVIFDEMNEQKSQSFIYNKILYIKDGLNYLQYDGDTLEEVEGYIPRTSISRMPSGGGEIYEDVNLLSDYRINSFCADGVSTEYFLDAKNIDNDYIPVVTVNGSVVDSFTVDYTNGKIIFSEAIDEPLTDGQDNVFIKFKKTVEGYKEKITKCTILTVFDNRVFFAGNPDYPNMLFHCSLDAPNYCSDLDYYTEGVDDSKIKALIAGNNALWVLKEPSQSNTTVFYHNPTTDSDYGKVYPNSHSSISTGCVATGINFNDDIVFFSDRGMEAISGDITTEQVLAHRSSLIDAKLLVEENYKNLILEEYEGYLLVIIDNKIYLADSRQKFTQNDHIEYEWYYWELSKKITSTQVKDGVLYLCAEDGIYTLTKKDTEIETVWTTPEDDYGYPYYQKTTNKKGATVCIDGEEVTVLVKTDNNKFEKIDKYKNKKGYIVFKIKKKKWKNIQLKLTSNKPIGISEITLLSYLGAYVKR